MATDKIQFYRDDLTFSEYYLRISTQLPENSEAWKHPYELKIDLLGSVESLFTYTVPPSIEANNVSKSTLHTEIQDSKGNLHGTAQNEVTYTVLSGGASGTLVGDNPATANGGIATIQLQATNQPGQVTIECTSPGLVSDTVTVYVYESGVTTKVSGHIKTGTTWGLASSPYEVTDDITIDEGIVLTIEPGVVVKFRKDTDLFVKGGLTANGSSYYPIIFTSNGSQLAGHWGGINFKSTTLDDQSILKYCEFYYGGSSSYGESAYPIVLDLRANPIIQNTTIKECRRNAIGLASGSYNVDVQINNHNLPLWLNGDLTIEAGAVLTIDPGILIKLYTDVDIFIKGGLKANGTAANPIIFTSFKDDANGGDSNNDGSSLPLAGTWGGVNFKSTTLDDQSALKYCEFYYGGSSSYGESAYPIVLDLRANPIIQNTTIKECRRNAIGLASGSYNVDVQINNHNLPLWLNSDLTIEAGAVLTIDPGILIKLYTDVDIFIKGGLKANGTAANPIIFTSFKDDSHGGDSNNDGSSLPLPGTWGGLDFKSTVLDDQTILNYCEFYYGGSSSYGESAYPIVLDLRANPTIQNTTIKQSRRNAIAIVQGTYNVDVRLNNHNIPMWLNGDLSIAQGAVLTIDPGVLIKLATDVDIFVNGGLKAEGTASKPIIFTSFKDDARGGDSNNDGSSDPLPGTWGGLNFKSTVLDDQTILNYCELLYGGSNSYGESAYPIVINDANPIIQHTTINFSRLHGIYIANNAKPDVGEGERNGLGGNRFLGFLGENKKAIYNNTTNNIYAKNNFWDSNDPNEIAGQIYDFYDNSDKGIVYFEPFIKKNSAPLSFNLLSPENEDTLLAADIIFEWEKAVDTETDPLLYDLFIYNENQDTSISDIQDIFFNFNGAGFFVPSNHYNWRVNVRDNELTTAAADTFSFIFHKPTTINDYFSQIPNRYILYQNYPNPFNPETVITYGIPKPSHVKIEVYNLLGQRVLTVLDSKQVAGHHKVTVQSTQLASGVYIYRIEAGSFMQSRKMLLLR